MTARFDFTLALALALLVAVGIIMVASASAALDGAGVGYSLKHVIYVVGAVCMFAIVFGIPLRVWEWGHRYCLGAALILAVVVLIPGLGIVVNGSRRWIDLGFFTIQTSEWVKLLVLVYLAGYLSRVQASVRDEPKALLRPVCWMVALVVLILAEPDFGTVVVLALLTTGMLFIGGVRLRHFVLIATAGVVTLGLLAVLSPYRAERIVSFLDPWSFAFGSGYQLTQALIAFGRGELTGVGLGEGVQKLFYLPEAHNDFIFAVIAEELGFLGATSILMLFVFVVLRAFRIARRAIAVDRTFAGFLCYGVGLLIGAQVLINVGVNSGVLPTKGLTLPFISFGGNSLLVCAALVGLAFRAHFESTAPLQRVPATGRRTRAAGGRRR